MNTWKKGQEIVAILDFIKDGIGIGVIKGHSYIVYSHIPKYDLPIFNNEQEKYQFYCGQIVPERYITGAVWIEHNGLLFKFDDSFFKEKS